MTTAARALLALCGLLGSLPSTAWALDPKLLPTQYGHRFWTVEQGLPQNSVSSILQTRDGHLWKRACRAVS